MKKLLYFEGLRAVLAIVVVLHHFAAAFYPAIIFGLQQYSHAPWERWVYATPLAMLLNGRLAVFVFFILTGFFVILEGATSNRRPAVWSFTVSRYLRLALPCVATTVLAYIYIKAGMTPNLSAAQVTHSSWLGSVLPVHPNLLTAVLDGIRSPWSSQFISYNFNLWPIHMFFLGSMALFLLSHWWRRGPIRTWSWAALTLMSLGTLFACFFLGALLAELFTTRSNQNQPRLSWAAIATGIMLGFFTLLAWSTPTLVSGLGVFRAFPATMNVMLNTVSAGLIVVGILLGHGWQRVLAWRPFVLVGKSSFSLYVIHLLVIATSGTNIFLIADHFITYNGAVAVTFVVTMFTIAVVTWPFYRFVERPSHLLAEKIKTWRPNNRTASNN